MIAPIILPYFATASERYMPDVLICATQALAKRQSVLLSADDRSGEIAGLILGRMAHLRNLAAVLPVDTDADNRIGQLRAAQPAGIVRRIPSGK